MPKIYTLRASRPDNDRPHSRRRGGFSPRQHAIYRPLVEGAWREVTRYLPGSIPEYDRRDLVAKDRWYRETLREKLGVYTTKQLNKTGDFEQACKTFEEIEGKNIYWQLRVNAGPIERARRKLADIVREHSIDEAYVRATAARMFDPQDTGAAHYSNLNANQLLSVVGELEQHFARQEA